MNLLSLVPPLISNRRDLVNNCCVLLSVLRVLRSRRKLPRRMPRPLSVCKLPSRACPSCRTAVRRGPSCRALISDPSDRLSKSPSCLVAMCNICLLPLAAWWPIWGGLSVMVGVISGRLTIGIGILIVGVRNRSLLTNGVTGASTGGVNVSGLSKCFTSVIQVLTLSVDGVRAGAVTCTNRLAFRNNVLTRLGCRHSCDLRVSIR